MTESMTALVEARNDGGSDAASVRVRGLDINKASPEELTNRLNGVGAGLASAIVENRQTFGPFLNVHDLGRVPGVGPCSFVRMTGLRWREDGRAKREKVLDIIGPATSGRVSLDEVAERFASVEGFEGCLIVDSDGDLLAGNWAGGPVPVERFSAFAPQVIQRMAPLVQSIEGGKADLVNLIVAERAYTMVPYEGLIFVAIHKVNRFSRRQIRVAQQVAETLGRMLYRNA